MTTLGERVADALRRHTGPAIEFGDAWTSWSEISTFADQLDALTVAGGADATVAFVPRNRPSSLAALLALLRQGRTIRMSYAFQSPAGIVRDVLRGASAFAVLDSMDVTEEVTAPLRAAGIGLIAIDTLAAPVLVLPAALGAATGPAPDEAEIEILTSGTTGPPKPFAATHAMIADHIVGRSALAAVAPAAVSALPPALLFFPIGNISGIYSTLPPLLHGQRVVLLERFSVQAWRDYVVTYRPPQAGMPAACVRMVLDADIPKEDLASLKGLGTGAAPLDPAVHHAFEDKYGIPILLSYGATEFGGPVAAMTPALHGRWGREKFGSVGQAIGGARLRVVEPGTGAPLPPGAEGLLQVVSPRMGPDWITTSDLAVIDADGFLFHRGRADGAIMRGGFKLLPETIEQALRLHPAIADAAVAALPDRRLGEVPGALVQVRTGYEAPGGASLATHLRGHLPATHIPVFWGFCADLPRTASHKTDRVAVKRLLQGIAG
ncbi:class I adenylate-forming enzyme family protein [Nitrospirillum iridis]|uniref:Acyl-coenzyme A synthetase/AMP-(Fatty) acid ligase n=1 Tax=Nitrospirillum iridis TaxID=765888 RepID=A0A7X0B047_9PROT|nr:fatty acid--CoA ligase family protein [Nitrospirillum iridis]MBB6253353.1 acyl-coenzyme A synthetase/AMP-(fatty) acid ligase [Nitrospirillum iridis]